MIKLTDAQFNWLRWLSQNGGDAYLDKYARVNAGGECAPQGTQGTFLRLVALGMISGSSQRLTITDYGRSHLQSGATA